MTPVCIRCNQPIPQGSQAQPVVIGRDKGATILGLRAQHPANEDGKGCQVRTDPYPDHLWWMFEEAEAHPFPAYRRWKPAETP